MESLKTCLDAILVAVATANHRNKSTKLTAFFPAKGQKATGELMIVGRAVNGWSEEWCPAEAIDKEKRRTIIENVYSPKWDKGCPMAWVSRDWGGGYECQACGAIYETRVTRCEKCGKESIEKRYNTATSAFYRTMYRATEALNVADTSRTDWPSYLIWSDLYKVAPAAGGNPSDHLRTVQHDACVEMLKSEIILWQPRRILFLTGWDWAGPFLQEIGELSDMVQSEGLVPFSARLRLPSIHDFVTQVVVAQHPQAKPESEIIELLVKQFSRLGV